MTLLTKAGVLEQSLFLAGAGTSKPSERTEKRLYCKEVTLGGARSTFYFMAQDDELTRNDR